MIASTKVQTGSSSTPTPMIRLISLSAFCTMLLLQSCVPSANLDFSPFSQPERKIETTTMWVERTAPACLKSLDQSIEVCFPPLSLDESQELSLSRIDISEDFPDEVGHRYQLEPSGLELRRPARWRFATANFPPQDSPETLRVARLSQSDDIELWQALDSPQYNSDALYGRSDQTGVFAVVDSDWVDIYNLSSFEQTSEADVMLANGDIDAARAAYTAILNNDPQNNQARLGRALCRILELPDSAPIRDLLTRCQLPPLSPALLYGAGAYMDLVAQDLSGELNLQINYGASSQQVLAETVVSRTKGETLSVRAQERNDSDNSENSWTLQIDLDLQQAANHFVVGNNFAASTFPGHIAWKGEHRNYTLTEESTGSIFVEAAGRSTGQKLRLRFENVSLTDVTGLKLHMDGLLNDIVYKTPSPDHPLFRSLDDEGPPYRTAFIRLLDACDDSVSLPYLFVQMRAFSTALNEISADLRAVLSAVVAGDLSANLKPRLPAFLLRSDQDLSLNARDLRILIALADSLDAALDLAAPYTWIGYDSENQATPLRQFIQEQSLPFAVPAASDDTSHFRQQRALSAEMLAADLLRNFMRVSSGINLQDALVPGRVKLDAALIALLDAIQQQSQVPGLFDLNNNDVRPAVESLIALLSAAHNSLQDPPINAPLDDNPGYSMQLWRFFSQAPDHQQLVGDLEPEPLFSAMPAADQDAADCYPQACYPRLSSSANLRSALLESFMNIPLAANPPATCASDADCETEGLHCDMQQAVCENSGLSCHSNLDCADDDNCLGQCLRRDFVPIPESARQNAWLDDQARFIHPLLWQVFAPLFQALPQPGLHPELFCPQ